MNQAMRLVSVLKRKSDPRDRRVNSVSAWQEKGDPTVEIALRGARKLGFELSTREAKSAGVLLHYAFGAGMGALYGAITGNQNWLTAGYGVGYGLTLWIAGSEIALPLADLGPDPNELGPEEHLAMFGTHIVYGAVLEGIRRRLTTQRRAA